jgi:DNA-binding GntR family transcriptional regulator
MSGERTMSYSGLGPLGKGAKAIYQQLRQEIINGELPERTVLQQVELAERFGVSRTPVREALQHLAHDGLVEFLSGQTAHVSTVTLKDSLEIRQIRVWLEVPALQTTLQQKDKLREFWGIMDQIRLLAEDYTPDSGEKLLQLDEQFHRWLLRTAGNGRVERIVGDLLDIMYRDHAFSVAHGYRDTRDNLLQLELAIRAEDRARVSQLLIEHIAGNFPLAADPVGG